MGTVYRARDTRLRRDVALKVLPEELRRSATRLARFEQEARLVAALNHPNIAAIYGVEDGAAGVQALVLELIEGKTLATRIAEGRLGVTEALNIARQIAQALDAAHEKGIVHRDLKPANIVITPTGLVKVLDFGVAKFERAEPIADNTLTAGLTRDGTVVGTPAYMSPEQARGEAVDIRTDIWAFGCVTYEMLTGRALFKSDSVAGTLAAVLTMEPDWDSLPTKIPPAVDVMLRRCLERERARRLGSMAAIRFALEDVDRSEPASRTRSITPSASEPSIAVLPFADMSPSRDHEWFSDGMAEEIINALAQIPGLKVIARTSAFAFKGRHEDIRSIAETLGVANVLEGSVRKAGTRVRITAQLITAADGAHLWSRQFDGEVADVFAIQEETANSIAAALKVALSPQAAPRKVNRNIGAYETYVKARHLFFTGASPESIQQAKTLLDDAIALDPDFARAYSLSGLYYTMRAGMGIQPAHEAMPLARALEMRALSLDDTLPEAHGLLGTIAGQYDYDWKEAKRQFELAMRPPVLPDMLLWYGNHYLLPTGKATEAVEAMLVGLDADPLNSLYRHHLAWGLRHAGRLQEAEAELRTVLDQDQGLVLARLTLSSICAQQGEVDEALELAEQAYAATPWNFHAAGHLAGMLARVGDTKRANRLVATLMPGGAYGAPLGLAVFHAERGDIDAAADWAARVVEQRQPVVVHILGPLLSGTPCWRDLLKMMNLPADQS
jgi:serine/threonine-protein kinase